MQNPVNFVNEQTVIASTTFGYAPGQPTPATLVRCNPASGNITVTLPPAYTAPPTLPPATPNFGQATQGAGGGFRTTIVNIAGVGTVTVAAAGSDTIEGTSGATVLAATVGTRVTLQTNSVLPGWTVVAQ